MNPPPVSLPSSTRESHSPLENPDAVVPLTPYPGSPPARQPAVPRLSWLDLMLASFVVLLAFFVASTPARNSDLWLHLATGRAIADGNYRFQSDPFTLEANTGIAHSWLYDLLGYELFFRFGGVVLVIVKASLVAVLAALLVRLGCGSGGLTWSSLAVALSVVAMSGRLLLQPALVSAVLLAVTLTLLERGRRLRGDERIRWLAAYGPICLVFALWANLDDWFLLGPLTVGLYLIGQSIAAIAGAQNGNRPDLPGLAGTLGVGLLACLLTPFHIHGFVLPPELGLSATADALQADPALRQMFVSPFARSYFHSGNVWNLSGLAYLALVLLGGLSFLGSRDGWRDWRLPVWLGLFALSAWSVWAVPFFAVASAPILARNVEDLVQRLRPEGLRREDLVYERWGRAASGMLLLGLLVAAWPGWLQGAPYEMRRWVVLEDPSLRQAAEKLGQWRQQDRLADSERGFLFSPKIANYCAYFCPAEKAVLNGRLNVSPSEAEEYVRVRQALVRGDDENGWRNYFRTKGINHLVLEDVDRQRTSRVYQRLIGDSSEWFLMSLTGNTTIFGWHDPQRRVPSPRSPHFSVRQAAYHPEADQRAPAHGLERDPEPPKWWSGFVALLPAGHPDRDAAALLLQDFDLQQRDLLPRRKQIWEVHCLASLVAQGGRTLPDLAQETLALNGFIVSHSATTQQTQGPSTPAKFLVTQLHADLFMAQDDAPSDLLFLALRAAWRGARADPSDAATYVLLGDAYLRLAYSTRERAWTSGNPPPLPFLRRLRAVQAATAYHRALLLDPDLLEAHLGLISLYERLGSLEDLALHHLREELRILRGISASSPSNQEQRARMLTALQNLVRTKEGSLERAKNSYETGAAKLRTVVERASVAQDRGLAETALKVLMDSDVAAFGREGVEMELGLLLITGQVGKAREWLLPEHEFLLGSETYHLYRLQVAMVQGDYEQADAELKEMLVATEARVDYYRIKVEIPQAMALAFAQLLLDGGAHLDSLSQRGVIYYNHQKLLPYILTLGETRVKSSDIRTMRGLLAVECGNVAKAEAQFRAALRLHSAGSGFDFNGRGLAEYFLNRLTEPQPFAARTK